FPGSANQTALATFAQAYPDIKLEQTTLVSSALAPRILQERQAGIFTWDVIHQPTTTSLQVLKPAGVLDRIKDTRGLEHLQRGGGWLMQNVPGVDASLSLLE